MGNATGTAEKKEKVRLAKIEEMTPEELEKFNKLPEAKQEEYRGRLALQDAQDTINAAREKSAKEREAKQAANKKEKSIKEIIKDVREGKLEATLEAVTPRFQKMEPPLPTEEYSSVLERIKTDSVSKSKASLLPVKPAYELTHAIIRVRKEQLIKPTLSGTPDNTLANSVRRYGMILPPVVRATDEPNKYHVMDGQRRYALLPEDEAFDVLLVSGFPDEDTAERAEVTLNRVRSLNVISVANALCRMKQRGIEDTEIRRDMGFKTGEIDKITSVVTNLIPELAEALTAGNITPSVALSIAKLPKGLQKELSTVYAKRVKDTPNIARISESDVEQVRQKRAGDAAKRDTPTLAGLAGSVDEKDANGGQLDKGKGGNVSSPTKAASKGAKGK